MNVLEKDWLTHGLIDFEYKKYVLLAYLQHVKKEFNGNRLYPFMSDLIFHYQNLLTIKENKTLIYENFPERITKADFDKLSFTYQKIVEDDNVMKELEDIILYAIPHFKSLLNEGKSIYEYVEENIEIIPIGVRPLRPDEGYFFINEKNKAVTWVYRYQITIFENSVEKFRGVHTVFLEKFKKRLSFTYENYKIELVKKYKMLPNPATYLIQTNAVFPLQETLLPVAKRLLVKYISAEAA